MAESLKRKKIVIVGGGFAGLYCARALTDHRVDVTLVDRRNFHLFQPLLYQVATGGLSPADIAAPLREILRGRPNCRVLLGSVRGFDVPGKRVLLAEGEIPFDALVLATGSRHHYFGSDGWEAHAPGLKTIEDATVIRSRVLRAFEEAEKTLDPAERAAWLTFVVVGGGPTGVELAGALAELARDTLRREFRVIDPTQAKIILVEGQDRVLSSYDPALSTWSRGALERLGVQVRTAERVVEVSAGGVALRRAPDPERIAARTVLWAAGVKASPLGAELASQTGAQTDPAGRVVVEADFSLPGHPELFVLGDLASYSHHGGKPLPGVAPVAMQAGQHVAAVIQARLDGEPTPAFRYRHRGDLATIGRASAVGLVSRWKLTGLTAWLAWLFVHLLNLAGFENRVLVLIQWGWSYFTRNRGARLITGETPESLRK